MKRRRDLNRDPAYFISRKRQRTRLFSGIGELISALPELVQEKITELALVFMNTIRYDTRNRLTFNPVAHASQEWQDRTYARMNEWYRSVYSKVLAGWAGARSRS